MKLLFRAMPPYQYGSPARAPKRCLVNRFTVWRIKSYWNLKKIKTDYFSLYFFFFYYSYRFIFIVDINSENIFLSWTTTYKWP
jgi:hypothetical protein